MSPSKSPNLVIAEFTVNNCISFALLKYLTYMLVHVCSCVPPVWSWLVERESDPVDPRGGGVWQPGLELVLSQWTPADVFQGFDFTAFWKPFFICGFSFHTKALKGFWCVCGLQVYDNGDSELDSKEFLSFLKHNESALNLTYSENLETNSLLRYGSSLTFTIRRSTF